MSAKKIAIYLDGTWNSPKDLTNVYTLYHATKGKEVSSDLEGPDLSFSEKTHRLLVRPFSGRDLKREKLYQEYRQLKNETHLRYYDLGVGTRWFDRVRGGTTGRGVSENISQAYEFLCHVWEPGDEIYVFGFSRGAYTARSLVGLLELAGLMSAEQCLDHKKRKQVIFYLHETIEFLHKQTLIQKGKKITLGEKPEPADWIKAIPEARQKTKVKFVGVWDTVGAIGVPERFSNLLTDIVIKPFTKTIYETLGNTEVCHNVEYAYHAMAIDEHRLDFQITPWTYANDSLKKPALLKDIQQQWFVGAHSNVGGGYKGNYLSEKPRYWIQEKAAKVGLEFTNLLIPKEDHSDDKLKIIDSYEEFAGGIHKHFNERIQRRLTSHLGEKPGGNIQESIHASVWEYYQRFSEYRPDNIPQQEVAVHIHQQGQQNDQPVVV